METPALNILQEYWGHSSFRSLQEDIISASIKGKDVVALLPTGGGKSLCFQVPALMQDGICIVVSPLIALMQDQVQSLKNKGIKAMAITGGISFRDLDTMLDNCIYGKYKFLYLSPERLQQEIVQERIKQMQVNLIAVDEAHCISQWGHDFRPAYRNISLLKEILPKAPMMALTATATEAVLQDIVNQLEFKDSSIFRKSFERKNIAYNVVTAHDKNYYLLQLLEKYTGAVIVYVRSRNATVQLSNFLESKNISAAAYHGGLSNAEKEKRLNQWLSEEKKAMVATNAFGMGIDKANVRCIIHYNLPESIESYFQEAGRAGRDEKPAEAVILTNESDIPKLKNQFLSALPSKEMVKEVYKKLNSFFRIAYGEGEAEEFNFNFSEFCNVYNFKTIPAYNVLLLLDRSGIITLSQEFHKKVSLQFVVSNNQLLFYLENNESFSNFVKTILRTYGGIYENKIDINLETVCKKAGIGREKAFSILKKLEEDKIIELTNKQHDASVVFLVPREDERTLNPILPYIKLQNESKKDKIEAVLSYISNNNLCRSEQLLQYFGETSTKPCGICSVCTKEPGKLSKEKIKDIYSGIIKILEVEACSSRKIVEALPFHKSHIIKVLKMLLDKEIIALTPAQTYKLKHL